MSIHQYKPVRFTLDMLPDIHRHLKVACAEDSISMHAFVTQAIVEKLEAREERLDEIAYLEGVKEMKEGRAESFEKAMEELGL